MLLHEDANQPLLGYVVGVLEQETNCRRVSEWGGNPERTLIPPDDTEHRIHTFLSLGRILVAGEAAVPSPYATSNLNTESNAGEFATELASFWDVDLKPSNVLDAENSQGRN